MRNLLAIDIGDRAFETYYKVPDIILLPITNKMVKKMASRISGASRNSGMDSVDLTNWLLCYDNASNGLQTELAAYAHWLGNHSLPWAAIYAPSLAPSQWALAKSSANSWPNWLLWPATPR